jgi:RND superfamily putative drug exporter
VLEKSFGSLGNFIKRRYKIIIAIWIVALIALLPLTVKSMGVTNYNVQFSGAGQNTMANRAQDLMDAQFNSSGGNSSNGTVVVLFVNSSFYSNISYSIWNAINSSYREKLNGIGVSGIISPYPIANRVVVPISNATYSIYREISNASNSTITAYVMFNNSVKGMENFTAGLRTVDKYFNSTFHNISFAVNGYSSLFLKYEGLINNASGLLFGIPLTYLSIYEKTPTNLSIPQKDLLANSTLLNETKNLGDNIAALSYYKLFYNYWNNSNNINSNESIYDRLNNSIDSAFFDFNRSLNLTAQQIFDPVFSSFSSNITSYETNATKKSITLGLVYNLTTHYGGRQMQIFNATYKNFIANGSMTLLSENITGSLLNESDPSISNFTSQFFNETPEQFASYFANSSSVNDGFVELQMNQSSLNGSVVEFYSSVNIPPSIFYSGLLKNETGVFRSYFINFTAKQINPLASPLNQNSTLMVSYFLSRGSENSSLHFSEIFLENHFAGYPYFHFPNPGEFVNSSVASKGNLSSFVKGNYPESGISLNSSLFHSLVPGDFSGYMIILEFSESSLNGNQLNTLNSYISNIQKNSDPIKIYYTSSDEISHGLESIAYSGLIYALMIGIVISIIIVGIYFRSPLLAFVPLLFFGVAFSITEGIVYLIFGIVEKTTLSFVVTTLSSILILGLSTDYSVYILNRYMKEKSEDKLGSTVEWAGHAVFTSGVTVIISYIVLALFNIPIIGDGGFVNALGITISLGVALTLLPSFIFLFRKRIKPAKKILNFDRIARVSSRHKKVLVVSLIVIFAATLVVYETTPTSFDLFTLIPNNEGKIGYYEMVSAYGMDPLSPNFVLLTFSNQVYTNGHFNGSEVGIVDKVATALLNYSAISQISTISYPFGTHVDLGNISGSTLSVSTILNQSLTFIGKDGKTVLINVYSKYGSYDQNGLNAISHVDAILKNDVPQNVQYLVGGSAQGLVDSSNSITTSTYTIVEILAVIIFAVLAIQLSSVFTPLRLLFNVGASVLIAVSIFYAVFHFIMNLPIIVFGPLFVIVTLFGVGLDYDIFLVTRTREAVMKGKADEDAIVEAINENASVVLVLGFILSGVFGALIFNPIAIISEIGFSVTIGVLIDTVISWLFLIPALMLILKKYNWWPSHIRKS